MYRYIAKTKLGAKNTKFSVGILAIEAPPSDTLQQQQQQPKVALCLHGHDSTCCVASWAAFFPALHAAGYHILALDAPCFGRSSGPTAQANLWRRDDAALVIRLLDAFGVGSESGRCVAFAPQCDVVTRYTADNLTGICSDYSPLHESTLSTLVL